MLKEHNKKENFLEKSYSKCSGETSPRPFSQNSKLQSLLLMYVKVRDYQDIIKLRYWSWSVIKRPTDSTTSTTSRETDITNWQASDTSW